MSGLGSGRRRKPTALHIVEGTFDPSRHAERANEPVPSGRPVKTKALKGRAAQIWDEYFDRAFWLTEADSETFFLWCCLAAEMERSVKNMPANRIGQWRGLTAQLGLDPSSRARLGTGRPKKSDDPAEGYFKPKAAG